MLTWLLSAVAGDNIAAYFGATAAVLVASGRLVFWVGRAFEGPHPWLLALSPTLPLYVVLNWDMVAALLTVATPALVRLDRGGWGALVLATAVGTKFFPIVLVPLVLLDRLLKHRWRDAALVSVVFGGGEPRDQRTLRAGEYEAMGYYQRWLTAIEALMVEKGILTREEVDRRAAELATQAEMMPPPP